MSVNRNPVAVTQSDIPKRYYSISEVSQLLGVPQTAIRFWERNFPQLEPRKSKGGHRKYSQQDVELLKSIYYLVRVRKHTLEGAREQLRLNPRQVRQRRELRDTLQEVRSFLVALRQHLKSA